MDMMLPSWTNVLGVRSFELHESLNWSSNTRCLLWRQVKIYILVGWSAQITGRAIAITTITHLVGSLDQYTAGG
jgi:hypothetical protein